MDKELFLALERGDLQTTKNLHKQNSLVLSEPTFERDSPLHIAAREDHLPIVDWILQVKPSLAGALNNDCNTPLHEAAKCGNTELVGILFQHRNKSAYDYNKFEETALIIASQYGHVETVKLLCKIKDYRFERETELSVRAAGYRGYPDIVKAIGDKPMKYPLLFSRPLLHWWKDMLSDKCRDVGKAISDIFQNDTENRSGTAQLHPAVHGGHLQTIQAVLNSFSRNIMTEKDKFGRCAIHIAVMKGSCDVINEFMSRWPDCVEIRSSDHKSVLHFAVEYDKFEVVQSLLLYKSPRRVAELVSRDHDLFHNTALHLAAKNGVDPQLVDYLLSFPGVDVNAVNEEGMTALDIASKAAQQNPNCAIIKQILEGMTALEIASATAPHNPNYAIIEHKLEGAGGIRFSAMPKYNTASNSKQGGENDSKQGGENDILNTHMVVASLIATVTFAAIFQIPGGTENDDKESVHYGAAKLAFRKLFRFFIFSDTAAFVAALIVVVAWLLRQLVGDSGRLKSELSHTSTVTLIVSIVWTMLAFVSATIIVIIPPNYEDLRSTHKKAFDTYKSLMREELYVATICLLYVGMPLLSSVIHILISLRIKLIKYIPEGLVAFFIIVYTFGKKS